MWQLISNIFSWLTARQSSKNVDGQRKNIWARQLLAQIIANNFWLIAVETELALIVMWNIIAFNFGFPLFKTQFDAFQLLLAFCGMHVLKIGHSYVLKNNS